MREEVRTHRQLAELATRQHGVVSIQQLKDLGYSTSGIGRAATAGRLLRVQRGVYAVGHRCLSERGHCLAAVLACGPQALLSHSSAAWLWGLVSELEFPLHVSVPTCGRGRSAIRLHHTPALAGSDRAMRERIPVTSVARTLLDVAASSRDRRLSRAIERAEQLGLFDLRDVDAALARATHHPGAGGLRRALDLYREPAFTRSEPERTFLELVREAGLPAPSVNSFVAGREIDMYWERERFAVELDGYEFHRTQSAFERDRLHQEELKLAGIEMIRITPRRIEREPEVVARRLATLLARRRG